MSSVDVNGDGGEGRFQLLDEWLISEAKARFGNCKGKGHMAFDEREAEIEKENKRPIDKTIKWL